MPAMNTLMNVSGGGRRNGIGRTAIAALAIAVAGISVPGHAQSSKGAGSTASEPSRMTRSGFLSNYAKLKPGESGIHCWRDAAIDLKQYDKILIANIVVSLKTDPTKPIDPTDLKTLVDYFHGALVAAMKPQLEVVTQPAPGVLVVRTALTNLVPTSSVKSLAGTATPFGFVAEGAAGAASGRPVGSTPYLGETGVEMQFLDGASGTILAECADAQVGRKYAAEMDKGAANAAKTWASGYMNSFQAWAYAKEAFDKWSGLLAKRLADLRGVTVAKK